MLYLDENVLMFFLENGKIRIYHTLLRQNTLVSSNVIGLLGFIGIKGQSETTVKEKYAEGSREYLLEDATKMALWDCMLNNPDNYKEDVSMQQARAYDLKELISQLEKRFILKRSKEVEYPLKKKGPFDRMKGTLHQQLGAEALFRKKSISEWWSCQKFNEDMKTVKETPYRYIQEYFLEKYFEEKLVGKKVLEIGCGTGYYCHKMAKYAKAVIGLDYQKEYIEIAQKNNKDNKDKLNFFTANIINDINIDEVSKGSFDYIFLIDIFLFFFSGEFQNELSSNKEKILKQLATLLAKGGKIVIMDPSNYWLIPRFGSSKYPFGVVTEYKNNYFRIISNLDEITKLFYSSGLVVSRILEPEINEKFKDINEREYHFMKQFPQWWVFELEKAAV